MKLNAEQIKQQIGPNSNGWRVTVVDQINSTNDHAKTLGAKGELEGLAIFAEHQLKGRGRREKVWIAPPGQDLLFSILLRPQIELTRWSRLTTLAALAICKAIDEELPLHAEIKWPNDVYVRGKKVCGLLAEAGNGPEGSFLVLGIGLNVNAKHFPEEIASSATSLGLLLDGGQREIDRNTLAGVLLRSLETELTRCEDERFVNAMEEVRQRSWLIGRTIRASVEGSDCFGKVTDLNSEGHLVLMMSDGSRYVLSSAENVRAVL